MSWKRLVLLPLMIVLPSCSMDGGSSGTGITSAAGDVIGMTHPEGIQVVVEGTDLMGETDTDGRFVVRGRFEGRVTLDFRRAGDALMAQFPITVPLGGSLTLHGVQIDPSEPHATVASEDIVCDALVEETACETQAVMLVSLGNPDGGYTYTLHLDGSSLHDRHGAVVACEDLQAGDRLSLQGSAAYDGSFSDADVEVSR